MLGLDHQLHRTRRVDNQLKQTIECEYLRVVFADPVRCLQPTFILPIAEVEGLEIGELKSGKNATAVECAVNAPVMNANQMTIGSESNVRLEGVGAVLNRPEVCGKRVLGGALRRPSMRNDQRT
jgi:hypothetical protein